MSDRTSRPNPNPKMRARLLFLLMLVAGAAFGLGLFDLFRLRFEAGDVYPEYSSLRSDPLGTMAFYESLERLPVGSVRRDYAAGNQLPEGPQVTYLHLAADSSDWIFLPDNLASEIDAFLARGGRLVITFLPEYRSSFRFTPATPPPSKPKPQSAKAKAEDRKLRRSAVRERWGVEFRVAPFEPSGTDTGTSTRVLNQTDLALPSALEWHSALVFTNLAPEWRAIYSRGIHPVVIERRFGPGSIVMATDSYFASNEALVRQRHAALLAWVVGSNRQVVFDEAHLGILDKPGAATLIRQYRLHGVVASLLLLAGLFIWKNALSFVPPYPQAQTLEVVAGRETAAGLVNLLRRQVPPRDLLGICFEEWTKSLFHGGSHSIARVDRAQAVLEAESRRARTEQDPVRAYREICEALQGSAPGHPRVKEEA